MTVSINMLFLSSIFFIPCLQGVIYLMESSGQKRGRISSVVEASSSAPTPPKKEYDIKKISGEKCPTKTPMKDFATNSASVSLMKSSSNYRKICSKSTYHTSGRPGRPTG